MDDAPLRIREIGPERFDLVWPIYGTVVAGGDVFAPAGTDVGVDLRTSDVEPIGNAAVFPGFDLGVRDLRAPYFGRRGGAAQLHEECVGIEHGRQSGKGDIIPREIGFLGR